MTDDRDVSLAEAMAHIKLVMRVGKPWTMQEIMMPTHSTDAIHIATILNAVASGALVPVETVQGLKDVYWKLRSYSVHDDGCKLNKPPYAIGSCSCGLTAALKNGETILTAWENRK